LNFSTFSPQALVLGHNKDYPVCKKLPYQQSAKVSIFRDTFRHHEITKDENATISVRNSVFIPGLPFPGRPGFPAFLIPGFPGIKTPSFPEKSGNEL